MCNFTIIIPHKNIPHLLQRCLCSIPKRDDLQVIIVDDNSEPEIVDFENFPGIGDDKIEIVFTKEGKGAGYARNIGLKYAKGEWILFADADDFFETENLNLLFELDKRDYDVIAWPCVCIETDGKKSVVDFGEKRDDKEMLYLMNEPWRKMIRHSLICQYNIQFQESLVSNDLLFSKKIAYYCQNYMFYNEIIYNWQRREESLSYKYSGNRLISAIKVSIDANKYLQTLNKEKYFDRTSFYLHLLWCENPIKYWWYIGKIHKTLGYGYAKKCNAKVCKVNNKFAKAVLQMVHVLKNKLKRSFHKLF